MKDAGGHIALLFLLEARDVYDKCPICAKKPQSSITAKATARAFKTWTHVGEILPCLHGVTSTAQARRRMR